MRREMSRIRREQIAFQRCSCNVPVMVANVWPLVLRNRLIVCGERRCVVNIFQKKRKNHHTARLVQTERLFCLSKIYANHDKKCIWWPVYFWLY